VLCLDTAQEALSQQPSSDPHCTIRANDLAYVIYTSGSTGLPKGVLVEHGNLVNTMLAAQDLYRFTPQDIVPCLSSFAFDISLLELFMPLLAGGKALLVNIKEMLEPKAALDVLSQITFLHAIPATMRQIAMLMSTHAAGSHTQLRALMVGGDAVSPELVAELSTALPQARLYVCYGPTEATIFCAAYEVTEDRKLEHQMLGHPIANAALRIYDQHKRMVPEGVVGEVYIGGPSVSRGYLNRAEINAEQFVELDGARWYRSGDLGRRLPDGSLAFAGRVDNQVKVRGYRIEVGEIETALESHPSVREAAVAVKPDARGEGRLVAYAVSEEGIKLEVEELRRYLGERLPAYMVPVVIVELEQLPLTALGKIDRKALPEVEQVRREYEAPRTAVEEVLCDIWGELLKAEQVGIRDSFFEMGGHSLLATQLMSRVRDAFNIEVSLRVLFEKPTVAEFAVAIEEILIAEIDSLSDDEAEDLAVGEAG
jgi:amino acid adenylation domain-containing protein